MGTAVAVAAAGALGTLARYGVHAFVARRGDWPLPAGTFAVNIAGSLLLGFMLALSASHEFLRIVVGLGFLGAFTTFSTLVFEVSRLLDGRSLQLGVAYPVGSLVAGLAAVYVGIRLGRL